MKKHPAWRRHWSLACAGALAIAVLPLATRPALADDDDQGAAHVRWDIIHLNFAQNTVTAGGMASARAADGSKITLTGSGTFVAPPSGKGGSGAVTGGGTWMTFSPAGVVTGGGTYSVTRLIRWERAPGTPPPLEDLIGNPAERSPGLAFLQIEYSDGSRGVLAISCHLVGTPDSVFEGISASKGFVDYYNAESPVADVDANRTLFHVRARKED